MEPEAGDDEETPTRVLSGRYRVDEAIGHGGMAAVYHGLDLTLGREVAVKILDASLAADETFRTRFRLEAQAASRMSSPAIVRVFDAGEDTDDDGRPVPYIVMELVHGRLLKEVIAEGPVPRDDAIRYIDGILEALEYSHRAGVIHRDIKPGNVMITPTGQVKVMDFGIARAVSTSSATVAETTTILGTAAYFSPEQAKGELVDARADLYSTGVVLYELLTGRQPFQGDSPVAVAYQHVSEAPTPPSEVEPAVSRALDAVVLRALAKDPFRRYPDAAAFRAALDAARDGQVPTQREVDTLAQTLYGPDPRAAAETARSLRQLGNDPTMVRTQAGPSAGWIWTGVALLAVLLIAVLVWVLTIRPDIGAQNPDRTVPDVAGLSYSAAEQKLADHDIAAARSEEPSSSVALGLVTRTDPAEGASVQRGTTITVYVSKGPDAATVPTLVGLTRAEAQSALEDAGLELGQVRREDAPDTKADIVLSASAKKGDDVPRGTTVDLTVATGNVTVVDFTQTFSLSDAQAALKNLGLPVTVQDDPSCPATDPRTVRSQSAGPGAVPVGTKVVLVSCSGSADEGGDDATPAPTPGATEG